MPRADGICVVHASVKGVHMPIAMDKFVLIIPFKVVHYQRLSHLLHVLI